MQSHANGTTMGRFPRLTLVRLSPQVPVLMTVSYGLIFYRESSVLWFDAFFCSGSVRLPQHSHQFGLSEPSPVMAVSISMVFESFFLNLNFPLGSRCVFLFIYFFFQGPRLVRIICWRCISSCVAVYQLSIVLGTGFLFKMR